MTSKLVLGTVQFGLKYGINHKEQPTLDKVDSIIQTAINNQIDEIDTAEVYGNALEILSQVKAVQDNKIKIISKVTLEENNFYSQLERNLERLKLNKIEGCYLHRFIDLKSASLYSDVKKAKDNQLIKFFGVSIYSLEELKNAGTNDQVDIIQIPFNVFDQSEEKIKLIDKAKSNGKKIYARSAFLQGLVFMNPDNLSDFFNPMIPNLKMLQKLSKDYQIGLDVLCLRFVLDQRSIDKVIFGVENADQLTKNLVSLQTDISPELITELKKLNVHKPELINPSLWPKTS